MLRAHSNYSGNAAENAKYSLLKLIESPQNINTIWYFLKHIITNIVNNDVQVINIFTHKYH